MGRLTMEKILLIANNSDIINTFTSMLQDAYKVYSVSSSREGMDVLKDKHNNIAVVLMDISLARKCDYDFSDQLQADSSLYSIPIIGIHHAFPKEEDMDCMEHGFFDLITVTTPKPLIQQRIAHAIRIKNSLSLSEVENMLKELPYCIFLKDTEGRYVFSSQYWHHLNTDEDPDWSIRGKTDMDIRKNKANARKAMEADQHIIKTGEGTDYVIVEDQDGIREYLHLIKRPVYDDNGRMKGIIALINNVTDYQLLKQEMEKRAKTDEYMITAMAADYRSIYYADLDKNECVCVRAASKKDQNMWEGRVFSFYEGFREYADHYVVEEDREAFLEYIKPDNIRAGLESETMISHRYLSTRSGAEKYEMLRIAGVRLIEDRHDHIVHGIAAGFSDVDWETRENMEQNRALSEALARAEEANAAKTTFLSSMSHEMRTPMNAIIGLDNIALRDPNISADTRDELEKIGSSARHLLSLINDILDMSRIESGRMELKKEEFSFRDFLDQITIIIHGQCEDKGLIFVCNKIGTLDEYFIGDDLRLKQIIINILGNAVKFTDAPGSVTFNVEQIDIDDDNELMRFTIKDTGIGMDTSFIPKLFDPFCQEDATSTNRYGGSGLGMAITKNIIDLMNGTIEVNSQKGYGTTFTVCIPLKKAVHVDSQIHIHEEEAVVSLEGIHVLIAEDMELNAEILMDLLDLEDINCQWAENGQRAVEIFEQSEERHFSAILMDMRMPVMDGLAATREIRNLNRPDAKTIPIIALTANAFEEDVKSCLNAGMNAHMSKPVDIDELIHLLGKLLAKQGDY